MPLDGNTVHFIAGAAGGTAGAVLTCPLEVLKTRLQSSKKSLLMNRSTCHSEVICHKFEHGNPLRPSFVSSPTLRLWVGETWSRLFTSGVSSSSDALVAHGYTAVLYPSRLGIISCFRNIILSEGFGALFKGLLPNLVGVAPSRAIYFAAYAHGKSCLNNMDIFNPDTPIVHIFAAAFAGFSSATCTNPIWVIKTRMQLDVTPVSTFHCAKDVYMSGGLKAFYKGVTASYYGLAETIIHLVIYEEIKRSLANSRKISSDLSNDESSEEEEVMDLSGAVTRFIEYMGAGAVSKTIATCVAYPHEVARTRLREEGSKYRSFWQTLHQVYVEDGTKGLYRGLGVQLVRQIPNTAVMMATYEAVVFFLRQ